MNVTIIDADKGTSTQSLWFRPRTVASEYIEELASVIRFWPPVTRVRVIAEVFIRPFRKMPRPRILGSLIHLESKPS